VEENLKLAERSKDDYLRKKEFIFNLFPDLQRLIPYRHEPLRWAAANARHRPCTGC